MPEEVKADIERKRDPVKIKPRPPQKKPSFFSKILCCISAKGQTVKQKYEDNNPEPERSEEEKKVEEEIVNNTESEIQEMVSISITPNNDGISCKYR